MDREEMIEMLLTSLKHMNSYQVSRNNKAEQQELDDFIASERKRYEAMSDLELRNMVVMNFL